MALELPTNAIYFKFEHNIYDYRRGKLRLSSCELKTRAIACLCATWFVVRKKSILPYLFLTSKHAAIDLLGERTPVGVRLNKPPASIPEFWNLCQVARQFKAAVWSPYAENGQTLEVKRVTERTDGVSKEGEW